MKAVSALEAQGKWIKPIQRGSGALRRTVRRPFGSVANCWPPRRPVGTRVGRVHRTSARSKIPNVRRVASRILHRPEGITDDEQQVLANCQHLETTAAFVPRSPEMLTSTRRPCQPWKAAVSSNDLPNLHRFVRGIGRDRAAVLNGLTTCPTTPALSRET